MSDLESDRNFVNDLIEWSGLTANAIAKRIGVSSSTINRHANGTAQTRLGRQTLIKMQAAFPDFPSWDSAQEEANDPSIIEYVEVEILPTYAGMGGGGTGEGDREVALLQRSFIEYVLSGKPRDFLLVNVRGDSMEPDFRHGDQVLIDKRDTSPAQPGPFALWDGEWGEYVIKNVERSLSGEVRIFSSNLKYKGETISVDTTRIIGRPVWFGRRL